MVAKNYNNGFYFPSQPEAKKETPVVLVVGAPSGDKLRKALQKISNNTHMDCWKRLEDEMPLQGASFLGWLNPMKIPIICSCFNIPNDRIGHELEDDYRDIKNRGVTHWMKLPDPPVD